VDACVEELENERTQKIQAESSFALKLRNEFIEIEQKLDNLLDLQLDGALSQDEYIAKKTRLLNQKIDISENLSASKQKSDNRFELPHHRAHPRRELEKTFVRSAFLAFRVALRHSTFCRFGQK